MDADYIYTHDYAYDYLVLYFLPEIFDPFFREDYAAEIEEDERLAYSRYIAALLPYEKDYDQIVQKLYDKEDAIAASSFHISSIFINSLRLNPTIKNTIVKDNDKMY